jgi:hypothetical protein
MNKTGELYPGPVSRPSEQPRERRRRYLSREGFRDLCSG